VLTAHHTVHTRACGQYGEQSARVNRASTADRQTDAQTERQTTHTERETHTERASASGNVLCSDCTVSVVRSQCYHAMTMTMTRPTPTCTHTSAIDRLSLSLSLSVCVATVARSLCPLVGHAVRWLGDRAGPSWPVVPSPYHPAQRAPARLVVSSVSQPAGKHVSTVALGALTDVTRRDATALRYAPPTLHHHRHCCCCCC